MGIPIQKVLKDLPKKRRQKVKARAAELIREYASLGELRKDLGLTQDEIANRQGVKQVNISRLEKRNDMLLSTLHKYVESLGCELEINIRMPKSEIGRVQNLK